MDTNSPSADEILRGLKPKKSGASYDAAWAAFLLWLTTATAKDKGVDSVLANLPDPDTSVDIDDDKENECGGEDFGLDENDDTDGSTVDHATATYDGIPNEEDYIRYFYYLVTVKKFKVSSIWATYSRLNNCHQRLYGNRLQQWPRIKLVIKTFESGYKRKKTKVFSRDEIFCALQLNLFNPLWLLRKSAIILAYCGGLRCAELKSLKFGDLSRDQESIWIRYDQAKQKGEAKENKFLVPFDPACSIECLISQIH
jgi:hypothetical protein